jgi:lysophospholipase
LAQSPIGPAIQLLNATIPQSNVRLDVALYPNPFLSKNLDGENFIDKEENLLQLVDGAFNGEQLPLQPLLVKARGVDVILAIDAVSMVWPFLF